MPEFLYVNPGELYLPPSRSQGADPGKLARQLARHGNSLDGMPALQVTRGKDGLLRINDGVTRATRAAKLRPGELVIVEVDPQSAQLECHTNATGKGAIAMIPDREELFLALAELSRQYPNWRLGQLVANAAGWADQDVWDIEDERLLHAARLHLQQLTRPAVETRA